VNQKLRDARGRVERLRKELNELLTQAGPELDMTKVSTLDGDSASKVAYFQSINAELNDAMKALEPLENEYSALVAAQERLKRISEPRGDFPGFTPRHNILPENQMPGHPGLPGISLGKMVFDEWCRNGRTKDRAFEVEDVDPMGLLTGTKTLMTTAAGWSAPVIRTGRLVEDEQRPIQVLDILPSTTTTSAAITYMEETTFTNAGAETAEGGTYAESALALTEQTSPVRKIATFLPVTDEQLDDIPQVQGYINNRLPFMLRQRLDAQVLVGNGTAPNLRGITQVAGIQTQARGTDPTPDAVFKAMVKVRVTGRSNPSAIILHPTDWQNVRLLRTADGLYIWGNPSDAGVERMWGLPVVQADSLTQGTGLVGDFATYFELAFRRGIEVRVSDSHSTFFVEGKQAMRADVRVATVTYRPTAFSTVTGL
jgi:HK97 family phage major capsid protein